MQKTTLFQMAFLLSVGIIVGSLIRYLYPAYKIEIDDQPVSNAVVVKNLILGKGGFLVFNPEGADNIVGSSDYLPAGKYSNLSIELYPTHGRPEVMPETRLKAIVYEDNGEKIFDKDLDKVARNFFGQPIEGYVYLK